MEWIPVTERLPETKDNYLICHISEVVYGPRTTGEYYQDIIIAFYCGAGVWSYDEGYEHNIKAAATHWMPLPAYPHLPPGAVVISTERFRLTPE